MWRLFGGRSQPKGSQSPGLPYLLSDEEDLLDAQALEERSLCASTQMYGKPSQDHPASSPKPSASTSPGSSTPGSGADDWSSQVSNGASGAAGNPFRMGKNIETSACAAAAADVVVLTLVRSSWWSEDGSEDLLTLEIASTATVAEVKERIADLYEVPVAHQQLQRSGEPGDAVFSDSTMAYDVAKQPIYLLPTPAAQEPDWEAREEEIEALQRYEAEHRKAIEEQEAMARSVAESLQGVCYKVLFAAFVQEFPGAEPTPQEDGSVSLQVEALAFVGDVQQRVEKEMLGTVGKVPLCLIANGQVLPPHLPLHFAGVTDGATVMVVRGPPDCMQDDDDSESEDSLHEAMLQWAGGR